MTSISSRTMDIFKLLARSTGLQKSAPRLSERSTETPSAGLINPSQGEKIDEDFSDEPVDAPPASKKRKRGEAEAKTAQVPVELDFFQESAPIKRSSEQENGKPFSDRHSGISVGSIAKLDVDECRKILQKHKLKITIVNSDQKKRESKRGTKKSRQKTTKEKHNRPQLLTQPLTSFIDLRHKYNISKRLFENIRSQGYKEPTEVQIGALPLLLGLDEDRGLPAANSKTLQKESESEIDLLIVAPTGSGKTLAFLVPVIQRLIEGKLSPQRNEAGAVLKSSAQALVIAPTHELVDQILNETRKLVLGTGVRVASLQKGSRLENSHSTVQVSSDPGEIDRDKHHNTVKADILISTPMMMLNAVPEDFNSQKSLPSVRYLILDEADVLLDPLFREQTLGIWNSCTNPSLQVSLWSATIGSSIETLAQEFIQDRRLKLQSSNPHLKHLQHHIIRLVVGLKDSAIPQISHKLIYAATEQGKLLALRQILHPTAPQTAKSSDTTALQPPFLIFTQTIPRAIALHSELLYDIPPEAGGSSRLAVLHADLSATARASIMTGLRTGEIWIVITTDLLARGVDIRGINGIVNYDIPTTGSAYVHRAGRTGRQGRTGGVAITLYTKDDIPYVKNVANVIAASERAKKGSSVSANDAKASTNEESSANGNRRSKATSPDHASINAPPAVEKWLLDALPTVSKRTKAMLKKRGVESRRTHRLPLREHGKGVAPDRTGDTSSVAATAKRKNRISTKSGYDRRMEGRRRGAVRGSLRRGQEGEESMREKKGRQDNGKGEEVEEEWSGLDG